MPLAASGPLGLLALDLAHDVRARQVALVVGFGYGGLELLLRSIGEDVGLGALLRIREDVPRAK